MPGHGGLGTFSTSLEFVLLADELTQLNAKRLDQVRDIDERRILFPSLQIVDVRNPTRPTWVSASWLMPAACAATGRPDQWHFLDFVLGGKLPRWIWTRLRTTALSKFASRPSE